MDIKTLQSEMIAALKAGEKEKKDVISMLIGNIKKTAIDKGCRENISDDLVDSCILKELKTVQEQIDTCPANRTDLMTKYKMAKEILSGFAPKMMSEDEVRDLLIGKFSDVIASKNKGLIMKTVMPELKGKADGKTINMIVAELCK